MSSQLLLENMERENSSQGRARDPEFAVPDDMATKPSKKSGVPAEGGRRLGPLHQSSEPPCELIRPLGEFTVKGGVQQKFQYNYKRLK